MWRMPSLAITADEQGMHEGTIEGIELRRGDRYLRLKIAGLLFDMPGDDDSLQVGTQHRFTIDSTRVTVWPSGELKVG